MPATIKQIPHLRLKRVLLTPFTHEDAGLVQKYAGDYEVARTTLNIPHPYPDGGAETWIRSHGTQYAENRNVVFAVRLHDGNLLGAINLGLFLHHCRGEIGYWIGRPFWGNGYCTEATLGVIHYGFTTFGLNKICSTHMSENPASGRVMQKAGMTREGYLKQHCLKDGKFVDIVEYAILRSAILT